MASITIRRLEDAVKAKLRARAAQNRRSMEEEAREILRARLRSKTAARLNLAKSIRSYIEPLGGVELAPPRREPLDSIILGLCVHLAALTPDGENWPAGNWSTEARGAIFRLLAGRTPGKRRR